MRVNVKVGHSRQQTLQFYYEHGLGIELGRWPAFHLGLGWQLVQTHYRAVCASFAQHNRCSV